MSLINKMLRDLDARGGDGTRADASSQVRPVSYGARGGLSPLVVAVGLLALALLGGGGFAAWKFFKGGKPAASAAVASHAPQPAPVQPAIQQNAPVAPATADEGPPVVPGDIAAEAHRAAGERLARKMEERNAAARRAAAETATATPAAGTTQSADGAAARAAGGAINAGGAGSARKQRKSDVVTAERLAKGTGRASLEARAKAAPLPAAGAAAGAMPSAVEGSETGLSPQQKAENEYRRALAKLQDARVSEAIASLEQAVALYPRHEAARQTLVGLLLEAGRTPEAIRHLALATSLDPQQANMAMLLARLQLENGGNALETMQRSLPYAESNPDYRAMMAGILQRANRNKEAVEHYQAAVRLQPANGVWWMGMGISLQADKRNPEARLAFQRAKDSGRLTPELQTFVERRLQQLD
ncbi:tetratricopeptide repeat protein [Pseudoduganella eburnea]|uniref:Tetratricopeptide repeat protein n=1 Tax=Massilia eburnea TaxID=1776165 RepID=A0A6L6QMW9_9BURK|nr:tetratricopeptide repeat protein [Massilia eburnea]MTW13722.1 tetratricopeptide repeat protein [Massilia eburnea]